MVKNALKASCEAYCEVFTVIFTDVRKCLYNRYSIRKKGGNNWNKKRFLTINTIINVDRYVFYDFLKKHCQDLV